MPGIAGPPGRDLARAVAAEDWAARARAEREAHLRFDNLASRLNALGARPVVVDMARTAVADEARHAGICDDMTAYLGAEPCVAHRVRAPEFAPTALVERDRVLYEVVSFCCINESINAALLTVSLQTAEDRRVADALRAILRDEVGHARLGWAHLSAERRAGRGGFLSSVIPGMLIGAVRGDELFRAARSDGDYPGDIEARVDRAELAALGHVSMSARVALFAATLRDVVFPGLELADIDTAPARTWLQEALVENR